MNKVKRQHRDYDESLRERLQDTELALAYLNEALADEDQRVFLLALKHVLAAQGGDMTSLAEEADLNRQNLHRILSNKGNPQLKSIRSILHALGLELSIRPL